MDMSKLDPATRQHMSVYKGFITFTKAAIIVTIIVLGLMAIALL
jgi:hypothetical protein